MLASNLIPLALATAAASVLPSVAASPIQFSGQAPSVLGTNGEVSHDLLQREFKQGVERSIAQLASRGVKANEDCSSTRRSRKAKRSSSTIPLVNSRDQAYLAQVSVGTPAQQVNLIVDTGSADLLIPETTSQFPQGTYDKSKSRTIREGDGSKRSIAFGQGAVEATVVQDKVRIGNFIKVYQPLALFDPVFLGAPLGILGLAFSSISKLKDSGATFFDRLRSDKTLDQNLFGLFHSRGGASGSELTIGAVDSSRYTGELTTIPVKSQTHWTLQMNHATLDGESIFDGPVYSAVDSGSTSTIIPKAITDAYFAKIPGTLIAPENNITTTINGEKVVGQLYEIPCDAVLPSLGFVFDGSDRVFTIAPEDSFNLGYNLPDNRCVSSLIGADVTYFGQKAALIGVPLLKSYYSIFNFDDATVSFATAKH